MPYLFTSESVSEGHPDKIADQISDALLDHFLAFDPNSKVACETLVTTGQVVLAGEVKSDTYLDVQKIAREVINRIGYTKSEYMFEGNSCGILSAIHEQSPDINQGVERDDKRSQGAGDQGMMFGYATAETKNYMPLALDLSHRILRELSFHRRSGDRIPYLRPDSKAQVTIEYSDENIPLRIDSIVVSTQHDPFDIEEAMLSQIRKDIKDILIPDLMDKCSEKVRALFNADVKYYINPTGKFVIGGPHGDTGLTGRKIIVDTYGGKGGHGGGAFSGKDPSKVDRSAAYAARHLAKNLVACGISDEILVQLSYAIGVVNPMGLYIHTFGKNKSKYADSEIARELLETIDLSPYGIEKRLKLRNPMYFETASYGHMGRDNEIVSKVFHRPNGNGGETKHMDVGLFTWEKLDLLDHFSKAFM